MQSGIHMIDSVQDATEVSGKMLGYHLITKQSGIKGKLVSGVYIVERVNAKHEASLFVYLDGQKD